MRQLKYIFLFIAFSVYSQEGQLDFKIIDFDTRLPLEEVNVIIEKTKIGGVSNAQGYLLLENVPFGTNI